MSIMDEISKQIEDLEAKRESIRSKCSHPSVKRTPKGDSGNILTGRDASYWDDCECELCGKRWSEDA